MKGKVEMRVTCLNCHTRTSGTESGLCPRCVKLVKFSGMKCTLCPTPIGRNNKSGLCAKCRIRLDREMNGKKCYDDVSSLLRRRKTGVWVTCHMPGCDERFELVTGQHPKMAWCNRCKKTPNYKNYEIYKNMTREVKI